MARDLIRCTVFLPPELHSETTQVALKLGLGGRQVVASYIRMALRAQLARDQVVLSGSQSVSGDNLPDATTSDPGLSKVFDGWDDD